MWLMGWTMWKVVTGIYLGDLVCLVLTLPVQTWLAKKFYLNAWKSIKHGSATMYVEPSIHVVSTLLIQK